MLSPEYLQNVTKELESYFYDLETEILKDIAERVRLNDNAMTSTSTYQLSQLRALGASNEKINSYLSKALKVSKKKAEQIISDSTYTSVENDNVIFKEAYDKGLIASFSYDKKKFKDLIIEGVEVTTEDLANICNTTLRTSQAKLTGALNNVYLQVTSGAFTMDQAVDNVVSQLSKEGLGTVEYKSGVKRNLDSAVRLAVRSSVNKTACKAQEQNLDDFECNLVEVTSHLGARPEHAMWQGKIYWRLHKYKNYSNFVEATRYGYGDGLGGWNCRHSFYPFFEGISEKTFEHYKTKENNELYDLQQQQRYNERKIREWKRRRDVKSAAGLDTLKESQKLKYWNKRNDLLISSDERLKHNYAREKAYKVKHNIVKNKRILQEDDKLLIGNGNKKELDYLPNVFRFSKQKESNLIDVYADIDKKFLKDGFEHMAITDCRTGKLLRPIISSNSKKRVSPDEKTLRLIIESKPKSLTLIHNHPKKTPFSITDIITTNEIKSIKESIVINSDGEAYFLSIPLGKEIDLSTDKLRKKFKNDIIKQKEEYIKKFPDISKKDIIHLSYMEVFERLGWNYGRKRYG